MIYKQVTELKLHKVHEIIPEMATDEWVPFLKDITKYGIREPIKILDNVILDGRMRYKAALKLGIKTIAIEEADLKGESPTTYAVKAATLRRHLTVSDRAMLSAKLEPIFAAEAKERQEATYPQKGQKGFQKTNVSANLQTHKPIIASEQAAQIFKVSPRSIAHAKAIIKDAPELAKEVEEGKKTVSAAYRQVKLKKDEQQVLSVQPVEGKFRTIMIDPPWDWGDEGDADQFGRSRPDYVTLPFEKLLKLPVPSLADTNCHLYLWITNRSLPKGFALIKTWGFRYITCLTWCKPSFGLGNYFRGQTEHMLFAIKGSQPLKRRDVGTWFQAKRGVGGHSSKPIKAYEIIESCSLGPYLEMFARAKRPGWTQWGIEIGT